MVSDQTVKNLAEAFERSRGSLADRLMTALKAGQAGGGDKRGMQSAALLVVRKNGGYLGANDRFIDIRVYDAKDPIAELERLLALHKLHFFPSEPRDLLPITPAIVAQLEPILLAEPVNQPEKWLARAEGSATPAFLEALKNFMYWENYDVRVRMDGKIDRVVLEDIIRKRKRDLTPVRPRSYEGFPWPQPPRPDPSSPLPGRTPASSGIPAGSRPCSSPRCGSASATTACARC